MLCGQLGSTFLRLLALLFLKASIRADSSIALISDHASLCVLVDVADASRRRRAHLVSEHRELLLIA